MNTPTLTLKADRVAATILDTKVVLSSFRPAKATIKAFDEAQGDRVVVDIDDETGLWSNGRSYDVMGVTVSEDDRAMVVVLSS